MQISRLSFLAITTFVCLIQTPFCQAEDDVIETHKTTVPVVVPPSKKLPPLIKGEDRNKYSTHFRRPGSKEEYYDVTYEAPDYMSAFAKYYGNKKLWEDDRIESMYHTQLKRDFDSTEKFDGSFGDTITFSAYMSLDLTKFSLRDVKDWDFYLYPEKGKRLKPFDVTVTAPSISSSGSITTLYIIRFHNETIIKDGDKEKKIPVLSVDTKSFSLAMAGNPATFKVQFDFSDPKSEEKSAKEKQAKEEMGELKSK